MLKDIITSLRKETYLLNPHTKPTRLLKNQMDVFTYLSEDSVLSILKKYDFEPITNFPRSIYRFKRNEVGIQVFEGNKIRHEFDEIGYIGNHPVVIEVKSSKLNNFENKIPRSMDLGKLVFNEVPSQLVFFPFQENDLSSINKIAHTKDAYAIDTGWTHKKLSAMVNKYYSIQRDLKRSMR